VGKVYRSFCRGLLVSLALTALVAAGCAGPNDPYPVKGTVFLDGQPATELAGGTVTFDSTELHKSASGEIQADGTYCLGSLKKDDGAVPGTYLVTVSPPERPPEGERGKNRPHAQPGSFIQPKDLEVTVEQKSNDVPIQLQRTATGGRGAGR
jgi:hypothetical protein